MGSPRKSALRGGLIVVLAILAAAPANAQVGGPPTPPTTLWNFLGIPQGIRKLQGATRNRRGNHPNREPKPPLKAIADPANLESKDPSIKKAAEIKQAEDLKKQKIKAVKYLASIGCGCYDVDGGVTAALVASMSDCTEDVRYETIKAISEAAEEGCCAKCGSSCCCNKDILTALAKTAYERDDHGCYVEPSERVRQAAAEAMQVCCPNDSPPVIIAGEPPEPERETAEEIEEGELRETAPGEPAPPPPPTPDAAEPLPTGGVSYEAPLYPTPVGATVAPAVGAVAPADTYGYGAIVDVSPQNGLAHVHFDQADAQASVGSVVGVYQQMGDERRLVAKLQVVASFPGSAHVAGSAEELSQIARGDMVLRPMTASVAAPIGEPVATQGIAIESSPEPAALEDEYTAPAPATAQPSEPLAQTQPQTQTPSELAVRSEVVQASELRPTTPAQRPAKSWSARRPVSAVFMR